MPTQASYTADTYEVSEPTSTLDHLGEMIETVVDLADVALTPMVPAYRKWYREHVIPDASDLVKRSFRATAQT